MTYSEIGYDAGLLFDDLERFVTFLIILHERNWRSTDSVNPGHARPYVEEWARAFARGLEYEKSDEYERHILSVIDAQRALKEEDLKCPKR